MKSAALAFSWIVLTIPILALAACGCNRSKPTEAARNESRIGDGFPKELLDPGFLKTLNVAVTDDYQSSDIRPHPLIFEPGSPQSKQAVDLLLWLLSRKDIARRPPSPFPGRADLRVEFRSKPVEVPVFVLLFEPVVGTHAAIRLPAERTGHREWINFVSDDEFLKRASGLWQSCGLRPIPGTVDWSP